LHPAVVVRISASVSRYGLPGTSGLRDGINTDSTHIAPIR